MADKYHRLITFVVDICPRPIRDLFITKAKAEHGFTTIEAYILSRKADIDNLLRRNKICSKQYDTIYPHGGPIDVQAWDITLATVLIKELFRTQLSPIERDRIQDIKNTRNDLQHIPRSGLIDDTKFNDYWDTLEYAVVTLFQFTNSPLQKSIKGEINDAKTESMPNLVRTLQMWHNEIEAVKKEANISNTILRKASVKRKTRSGVPEWRMKIVDKRIERMKETLARGLKEENDCNTTNKDDIMNIKEQLQKNHRVVITGFDRKKIYQCALTAVNEMNYPNTDLCLEVTNPSDWKLVDFEDAKIVVFREPFGRFSYDAQKVEVMLEEFDNMVVTTDEDNDHVIDIIIVVYQSLLIMVTKQQEHEMLSSASTVYIDSTADNEAGVPEKRMKIVDKRIERMKETLARGLKEENDCNTTNKDDIMEIKEQLQKNHRVIITGFDRKKIYQCALTAVNEMNYPNTDLCLEVTNPSDWKRVGFEDAKVVLFREPFGRASYDAQKVEVMLEEFDNMVVTTDEDNDHVIDIIIVVYQSLLTMVTKQHEHEMLSPASTVYIDSTADNEAAEPISVDYTVLENLREHSKMMKRAVETGPVDEKVKEETENLFLKHNAVVIIGSEKSGQTSLAFQLLSSYDLTDGEDNFLVLTEPDELKYVRFGLKPVLIIKLMTGTEFDKGEASKWFRQFPVLYAAVRTNKAGVIFVTDGHVFQSWKSNMPHHPLLENVVYTDKESREANREKVTTILSAPSTQSDQTSESGDTRSGSLRAIKSFRIYDIRIPGTNFTIFDICVLPTGEVLLAGKSNQLIKLDVSYAYISQCTFPSHVLGVCYTGNNEVVVSLNLPKRLQFVNFTGNMTLTRKIALDHSCPSLACHGNLLYALADDSVHVYTTDGVYQRCLYTGDGNVLERWYTHIAVSNGGDKVYISRDLLYPDFYISDAENDALITINSSGPHEYTRIVIGHSALSYKGICVDDQGYVYVGVNDESYNSQRVVIKQVSSDERHVVGTLFELEDRFISTMCFDKEKSALVLAGMSDKLKVLQFR